MKKIVTLLIIAALVTLMIPAFTACTPREQILKICNWEDYIDPDALAEFETYYEEITGEKITVQYDALSTNEEMLSKIAMGQADYDVVCPSDYMIEKMRNQNLLLALDKDLGNDESGEPIENYLDLASDFATGRDFDPTSAYSVGYMWGTMGILYNNNLINEGDEIDSWADLWNSDYTNQILMKDSVRDSYLVAAIYSNLATLNAAAADEGTTPEQYQALLSSIVNDTTAAGIQLAQTSLIAQRSILKGYEVDEGKQDMIDGQAVMSLQWAGDAVYSISEAPEGQLSYVIPEEGSNVFFDGWVIPKYAGNFRAAMLFINYMCMPSTAIANMDYIGYTSVISSPEVIDYLNENYSDYEARDLSYFFGSAGTAVHADPNMFPDADLIPKLVVMRDFGASEDDVLAMWNAVKAS